MKHATPRPPARPHALFETLERRQYLSITPTPVPLVRVTIPPLRASAPALTTRTVRAVPAPEATAPAKPAAGFAVYNATVYADAPDLSSAGLGRITVTADRFLGPGPGGAAHAGAVDEASTRQLAREAAAAGRMLVLDVGDWALDQRDTPGATVDANVDNLLRVIGWLKDERPDLQVGLSGAVPLADWSAPKNVDAYGDKAATSAWAAARLPAAQAADAAWKAANARLAPLGEAVDFLAPSLRTWYVDPAGWDYFAGGTLAEAAKYGKRVVPIIDRDVAGTSAHAGEEVPDALWAQEREFVAARADGVILAGGEGRSWNPDAAWWRSTEAFARALATPGELADGSELGGFSVEDQTNYTNVANLGQYGLNRNFYFTNGGVWKDYHGDVTNPDEQNTRLLARNVAALGKVLVLNIEHWPVDIRKATKAEVDESVRKLKLIVDWLKDERPELKVAFYGIMPLRDYWIPVTYQSKFNSDQWWRESELAKWTPALVAWQDANDYLKPLAEKVDYILPSLYTFYDDPDSWQLYADWNIAEAQRYGKPVVPVLNPQYNGSVPTTGTFIDGPDFRAQLDATRRLRRAGRDHLVRRRDVRPQRRLGQRADLLHQHRAQAGRGRRRHRPDRRGRHLHRRERDRGRRGGGVRSGA